jgi:hypothetical protein
LAEYFNLPKTEYGSDKEVAWYIKNVRNVNPGDIVINRPSMDGRISFYRAGKKENHQSITKRQHNIKWNR